MVALNLIYNPIRPQYNTDGDENTIIICLYGFLRGDGCLVQEFIK
jgi:hypothetical protein